MSRPATHRVRHRRAAGRGCRRAVESSPIRPRRAGGWPRRRPRVPRPSPPLQPAVVPRPPSALGLRGLPFRPGLHQHPIVPIALLSAGDLLLQEPPGAVGVGLGLQVEGVLALLDGGQHPASLGPAHCCGGTRDRPGRSPTGRWRGRPGAPVTRFAAQRGGCPASRPDSPARAQRPGDAGDLRPQPPRAGPSTIPSATIRSGQASAGGRPILPGRPTWPRI